MSETVTEYPSDGHRCRVSGWSPPTQSNRSDGGSGADEQSFLVGSTEGLTAIPGITGDWQSDGYPMNLSMTSLLADDRLFEMEGKSSVAPMRAPAGAAKTFRPTFGKFGTRWGAANRCGFTSGLGHHRSATLCQSNLI
jgi:hypothetical protein